MRVEIVEIVERREENFAVCSCPEPRCHEMLDITQTEAETISRQTPNPGDLTNQGETLPIQLIAPDASEELVSSLLEGFEVSRRSPIRLLVSPC